jgi:hypothetical protein
VKADLLKRVFRAIATDDEVAVDKLLDTIVQEERKKGHVVLADQLENITKSKTRDSSRSTSYQQPLPINQAKATTTNFQSLTELPNSKHHSYP